MSERVTPPERRAFEPNYDRKAGSSLDMFYKQTREKKALEEAKAEAALRAQNQEKSEPS